MRLIENHDIDSWAKSVNAKSDFPYWIRELIQTSVSPHELRFPYGDAVWMPGLDGVVVCNETNPFVPMGESVWEVGTDQNHKRKAERDYNKRLKDKLDVDGKPKLSINRPDTVFIFVTPHPWADKNIWETQKKNEKIWKDVRVIDGEEFKNWLESAPSVALRFASETGRVPEAGLWTVEQAWNDWSQLSEPPASEELVVAGREEEEKRLIQSLAGSPETFTVRADSPREAWGFALAAMRRVDTELERESFLSRTIVVEDEAAASRLRNRRNLIILLKQANEGVSGTLAKSGCHVIVPEGNDFFRGSRNVIALPRPTLRQFSAALAELRIPPEKHSYDAEHWVEREARACGLSVTIFQRLNPHANAKAPAWAKQGDVSKLIPAVLAGRWNSGNQKDRSILCRLANEAEYDNITDQLKPFLHVNEPPLRKIEKMWTLSAPVDAFQLIAYLLRTSDLDRFKDAFIEVFGWIDPKVELPPDEWFYHSGDEGGHSSWLRSGLAETLLLIRERGDKANLDPVAPREYAADVMNCVPGLASDWRVLASIRDQYPTLMEAAPDPLLEGLEQLLEANPDDVGRLFVEGAGLFGGGSMHTGLLWGLEILAWSPDYLERVGMLLARLAVIDPGGKMTNRPINSLGEIFLWWHPGTNAGLNCRLATIDAILNRYPEVGWKLLEKLLPDGKSSTSSGTHKPRWAISAQPAEDLRTPIGQQEYLSALIDRTLKCVGHNAERWRTALEAYVAMSPTQSELALQQLADLSPSGIPAAERNALWEMLRELTAHHRAFQDAKWAFPEPLVAELENILSQFSPDDPVERNRWLFDSWLPDRLAASGNIEEARQQADNLRKEAVVEIADIQGMGGLVRLATSCEFPGFVAMAIIPELQNLASVKALVDAAIDAGRKGVTFAGQVSGEALKRFGDSWRNLILTDIEGETWSANVSASLMIWWPDNRDTWRDITKLKAEIFREYWQRKHIHRFKGNQEDQAYEIEQLLAAGRAIEVLHQLTYSCEDTPTNILIQVFDSAVEQLSSISMNDEAQNLAIRSYDLSRYLKQLRSRSDLPREEVAHREYQILPLLGYEASSNLAIHEIMANDPSFFVDVLCDVFMPESRDKSDDSEPSEEVRSRAQAGYRLLDGMETIPGRIESSEIDVKVLMNWIDRVRELAKERDRSAIADVYIGHVLAHAPNDPHDGAWPHRAIRNVFEWIDSKADITRGLMIERHNMCGVFTKSLYEGGSQERDLANKYRSWADITQPQWLQITRVLRQIAESWEHYAENADKKAEQDKLDLN